MCREGAGPVAEWGGEGFISVVKPHFTTVLLALIALALLVWSVPVLALLAIIVFLKRQSCFKNIFDI